jgi:DNA polymerase/3'-5' exonuclease PolX
MAKTDTKTVVRLLREYAQRTSLRGGNPYRSKAYLRAAESLSALSQPLGTLIHAGRLTEIPGVGDAIADIITKLYETGSHPSLEKMRKEMPEGVLELFAIPGLRPDKILDGWVEGSLRRSVRGADQTSRKTDCRVRRQYRQNPAQRQLNRRGGSDPAVL